jgi:hypothetical protein
MDKDWRPTHRGDSAVSAKKRTKDVAMADDIVPIDETDPDAQPSKHHPQDSSKKLWQRGWFWKTIIILIILAALLFVLVLPTLKGLAVYKALKASGVPDTYVLNMTGLYKDMTSAVTQASKLQQDVKTCQDTQQKTAQAQSAAEKAAKTCSDNLAQTQQERDDAQAQLKTKDTVIQNAANKLCCFARFDKPSINAYTITDNKISCIDTGGTKISC